MMLISNRTPSSPRLAIKFDFMLVAHAHMARCINNVYVNHFTNPHINLDILVCVRINELRAR